MFEVTAEMIERGRGGDPRIAAERRRVSQKVREAREKLTSTGSGHRAFDIELLRLYAERRKAVAPGVLVVGLALAVIAARWTSLALAGAWFGIDVAAIALSYMLARNFLNRGSAQIAARSWSRLFVGAETLQGAVAALIVLATARLHDPRAAAFVLIAMLLAAAMNATVTASIPMAVVGALAPMAAAIAIVFHPSTLDDSNLLFSGLALGTLLYFIYLARKLRASALQALWFQAEKDDLIAELEQSKANSDLARRRAEESNLAKSRFLATMSHELRTPLNAILGFSEVMQAELFGRHAVPAYKDYAHDIHSSGQHLLMLINEILDLSRVEAGRYELREESVDLLGIVEECRHLVALRAKKKDIAIREEAGERMPRLWADTRAVRQVALNLLSNAIKFTPQGGSVTIRLGATPEGGQFFSISDTGAGIPESEMPVVMSSFGRGSLAQKNAEEGTGLGLPIVKGLVDLHGGTFELTSKVREGTQVTVCFPPSRVMNVLARIDVEGMDPVLPSVKSLRSAA